MNQLAQLDHNLSGIRSRRCATGCSASRSSSSAGKGAVLRDVQGREYLDANSSIWTNLHGHNHPKINAAIRRQLKKIAHSSALGLANEPASLARGKDWSTAANPQSAIRNPQLSKVFFSDDGSTALEVALKLAYEFTRRTRGAKSRAEISFARRRVSRRHRRRGLARPH